MPRGRRLFKWAAILCAGAGIAMIAMPSASASTGTDGFTILYASQGNVAHRCEVIGSDSYGSQAIVCVDILTGTGSTDYWARGRIEAFCYKNGATEQCAQVDITGTWASGAGILSGMGQWVCGHQYGACTTGRPSITSSAEFYGSGSGCSSLPNSTYDLWTVADQGTTGIELPVSGKWIYLGANFSTGHYYVCP
jgi:hypothetical protein